MSDQPEGLGNVRKLRRDALKVVPDAKQPAGAAATKDTPPPFLDPRCPVRPIGLNGDVCYYLDQLGQLRELKARDHSRLNIMQMFGRKKDLLYEFWPRRTQEKSTGEWITTGWKPELAAECFFADCALKGVWSAEEKVRGAGAWSGPNGELVLHCGDVLLSVPAAIGAAVVEQVPGMLEGLVYPTAAPGQKPDAMAQAAGPGGPGGELLALLETWNWRRPGLDAHLLLGWIGAAMLGGALDWRVVAWITGGKATGKSTLSNAIKWLMGDHGMIQSSDSSAAGIRQVTKYASRPVALDEAEAEEDNRKMQGLIKLARDAASGSISIRGGQDHQAAAFTVRSCFLFSSILIPPLLGQDRSRIAVLELDRIEASGKAKSLALTPRKMEELGARVLRRLVQNWWRFAATVDAYRQAMARAGHSARGQDLFGTLLACADCLLADELPGDAVLAGWESKLSAATLAEIEGDVSDENACLAYLLSSQIDNVRDRSRQTIGRYIEMAVGTGPIFGGDLDLDRREVANRTLMDYGLKVVFHDHKEWLAIANMHRGLAKIFEATQWAARPGATGVWVQAIRRLPHLVPEKAIWFGALSRVTMVPAGICLRGDETISFAAPRVETPAPAADVDGW